MNCPYCESADVRKIPWSVRPRNLFVGSARFCEKCGAVFELPPDRRQRITAAVVGLLSIAVALVIVVLAVRGLSSGRHFLAIIIELALAGYITYAGAYTLRRIFQREPICHGQAVE